MRGTLLWAAAAMLLVGATPVGAASLGDVRTLLGRGEHARAREMLDAMLSGDERLSAQLRDEAALLRADLEEDGPAYEERLRTLLDRNGGSPREARLRLALGHALFARGEIELALDQYQKGRERGLIEEGSLWEGICMLALGDASSAREALQRAASSGNAATRQRALLALGDSHRLTGDPEEAIVWYRQVVEDPAGGPGWSASARLHEAECLRALKRDDEARRTLRAMLDTTPGSYDAPAARAMLRLLTPAVAEPPPEAESPGVAAGEPKPAAGEAQTAAGETQTLPSARGSFAIQLGAFTSEENAVTLAAAARERTDRSVRIVEGDDGLHRVLVGSFPDHDAAAAFGDSLGTAIGASATVVPAPEN